MRPPCAQQGCSPEKHTPVLQRRPAWPDLGGARVFPLLALLTNFFLKRNFDWRVDDLQYCISFRCTTKRISYPYTHTHSILDSLPMQAVTEHCAMHQVLTSELECILPDRGDRPCLMLCVGSCQDWKPACQSSPLWEGESSLAPRATIFQMVCMQFQSKFPFFPQVSKTDYTIYYFTFPQ